MSVTMEELVVVRDRLVAEHGQAMISLCAMLNYLERSAHGSDKERESVIKTAHVCIGSYLVVSKTNPERWVKALMGWRDAVKLVEDLNSIPD